MGRGPQVRPKWPVSVRHKDIFRRLGGVGRSDMSLLKEAKDARGAESGGLIISQDGTTWAYRGGCDRGARTWGDGQKIRG